MQDLEYAMAAKEAFAQDESRPVLAALGTRLLMEFAQAESERKTTENRWLQDLRQYKGQYDPEVIEAIGPVRSKAFVRKTRVKVKTADSRVEDLLFPSGSEKNWEIGPTPVPSVSGEVRESVRVALQQMAAQSQQPGQITKELVDAQIKLIVEQSSKKMAKVIDDQLSEVRYKGVCKKAFHSAHLYGTGIVKGPLVERRIRSTFVQDGARWVEKSESYVVPFVDYVPIWRFYPDMGADCLEKCRYVFERHQMTRFDLAKLAELKAFNSDVIVSYIKSNPQGQVTLKYIDSQLKIIGERMVNQGASGGLYEVLERWGYLTGEELRDIGVTVEDDRLHESFFSNVWLLPNGEVIKAVLQPINGVTWPYHIYYFDKDETSIFGEGLAAVSRDDQTMLNAATRLMLDNAAIASGPMVEVTPGLLSNMETTTEITPWKVFYRNSTNPGAQAVRSIELPTRLGDLNALANRFDDNLDEVTAIPRYLTGENMSSGAAGTSSGMSMLMGAANIMIKDLISNWDEGVTGPFITALYRWNMQFNPDKTIKGDFDVKARGSASLVAREVRSRQLDNFAAMVANPMDAPFIKRDSLLRQRAEANELTDVVKTEEEVASEQNNQAVEQQQQVAQQQMQLSMAEMQQKVALLAAQAAKAMAEVELVKSKVIETKVSAAYAGLQAGGVAVSNPHIAPAGDEILRSSGWRDDTPDPSMANLGGAPVQPAGQEVQPQVQPQTGMVGLRSGIETPSVE